MTINDDNESGMEMRVALVYNRMAGNFEFQPWHIARMIEGNLDAILARTYDYVGETRVPTPPDTVMVNNYLEMTAQTGDGVIYRLRSYHGSDGLKPVWDKCA